MVYDIKYNSGYKARLVASRYLANLLLESIYSSYSDNMRVRRFFDFPFYYKFSALFIVLIIGYLARNNQQKTDTADQLNLLDGKFQINESQGADVNSEEIVTLSQDQEVKDSTQLP